MKAVRLGQVALSNPLVHFASEQAAHQPQWKVNGHQWLCWHLAQGAVYRRMPCSPLQWLRLSVSCRAPQLCVWMAAMFITMCALLVKHSTLSLHHAYDSERCFNIIADVWLAVGLECLEDNTAMVRSWLTCLWAHQELQLLSHAVWSWQQSLLWRARQACHRHFLTLWTAHSACRLPSGWSAGLAPACLFRSRCPA